MNALVKGEVYEVGIRRILNRPDAVNVVRRRYNGTTGGRFIFEPEVLMVGAPKPDLLAPDQIASLEAVA